MRNFLVFLLLATFQAIGQKTGKISYGFINAIDVGKSRGIDYNAILLFNNQMSHYITSKDSLESSVNKYKKREFNIEETNGISIYEGMSLTPTGNEVVNSLTKKTLWSSFMNGKMHYTKEITPKIKWEMKNETKKIGTFECKKATCFFRGREYEAWYTLQIPLPFGPWKLNGLPGLILEAYDKGKFVVWYFKGLEFPLKIEEKVDYMKIPVNAKVMDFDETFENQIKFIRKMEEISIMMAKKTNQEFHSHNMFQTFIECEK